METFHDAVSQVLHSNIDYLSKKVGEAAAKNPFAHGDTIDAKAIQQIVEGVLHILDEGLEGGSSEIREAYIETIIPNIVRRGRTVDGLFYSAFAFTVAVSSLLTRELPLELREPALTWFAHFYAVFQGEIAVTARKAQG
jgi:hypothetical protein